MGFHDILMEIWYANQVKHKKVNGEEPGAELMKSSYSFRDAANLLGIHSSNLYEIWRDQNLKTITVDFTKRIPIEVFEEWYEHQIMYQKVGRMPTITDLEKTISVCRRQQPSRGLPAERSPNGFRWGIFQVPEQERR